MAVSHFSAVSSTFAMNTIASGAVDVTLTDEEMLDSGVYAITLTAAKSLIFPTTTPAGKMVIVTNLTAATHACTVKVSGQTGIAIAATKTAVLYCNGTDFVRVSADS